MQLGARQPDGHTLREHLQAVAAQGTVDPLLMPPEIPREVQALWQAFLAMSASRRSGMAAQPLTLTDIDAWCRLNGVRLTPWELDTLIATDAALLAEAGRQQPRPAAH